MTDRPASACIRRLSARLVASSNRPMLANLSSVAQEAEQIVCRNGKTGRQVNESSEGRFAPALHLVLLRIGPLMSGGGFTWLISREFSKRRRVYELPITSLVPGPTRIVLTFWANPG